MIRSLHIENFKCLYDVTVTFPPFTVLIGPNDSGKTSLLDALRILGETTKRDVGEAFAQIGPIQELVSRRETDKEILWHVEDHEKGYTYTLSVLPATEHVIREELFYENRAKYQAHGKRDAKDSIYIDRLDVSGREMVPYPTIRSILAEKAGKIPSIQDICTALSSSTKYTFDPDKMREGAQPEREPKLSATGDNLVAVIDGMLTGPERDTVSVMEKVLHVAIPTLRRITTRLTKQPLKSLEFVLSGNGKPIVTIPATLASDGAVLILGFLALAYGNTPEILLIEEPENGLHYSNLKLVTDMLRTISTGEIGNRPRQVIVTTHSPLLLNFVQPEEVRICKRDDHGGTSIRPMDQVRDIDKLREEFGTGELWYLLGEDGLLREEVS